MARIEKKGPQMTIRKWLISLVAIYFGIVLLWFIFCLASTMSDFFAELEDSLVTRNLAIVIDEHVYTGEVMIHGEKITGDGNFADGPLNDLSKVDTWLLLLNGYDSIRLNETARSLGLDIDKLAESKSGSSIEIRTSGLKVRLSPLPIYVERRRIVLLDVQHMEQTYRKECWIKLINEELSIKSDENSRAVCKRSS